MSLFNQASLVLEPAVYETSKVYATKPFDGSGDLSFSRSNDTATRVGPDGLIEKVRTNLLTYSNDFSNAIWQVSNTPTLTANYDTNPLTGANDAWRFQSASTADRIFQAFSGSFHNFSLYAKGTGTIRLRDSSGTYAFNMVLTSSWQRASLHIPASFGNVQITSVGGCDATIYAAQLETGDIATDYIATTTAAVSVGPVANVPRLDYLNSSCPRLLLEPQRTNQYPYSEQLNQWTASSATVTANYAVSPDGYTNADRVQFSAGGLLYISNTGSAGENTLSVYAKATNGTSAKFRFFANGAVTFSSDQTATGEWQRFTFTYTYSAVTAGLARPTTNGGVDDVIFWGFQHEIGAYATSYIPTLGAAVTRGADAASKTGISSLIGQTEGVLYFEFNGGANDSVDCGISLSDGTTANRILIYRSTTNTLIAQIRTAATTVAQISTTTLTADATHKVAVGYANNDVVFYVNGVQIGTDTSAAIPATNRIVFDNGAGSTAQFYRPLNQLIVFPTRLSNADLAALTA